MCLTDDFRLPCHQRIEPKSYLSICSLYFILNVTDAGMGISLELTGRYRSSFSLMVLLRNPQVMTVCSLNVYNHRKLDYS